MSKENLVSIKLSADELSKINNALKVIQDTLKPYLVTISTDDRKSLPKMNEKTLPFVKKALEYAESHPEFAPSYLSIPELRIDLEAFESLNKISNPFDELSVSLEDTTILCGSEAYVAALSYYNAVKQAVKMNVAGAKTVYDDLKVRFEQNGPKAAKS
jgi:hypothetical protein